MKGTVNPFEPWRPIADRLPPPLHVGRPWRPPYRRPAQAAVEEPLLVEPVNPRPRSKPPERPERPQRQPAPTSPPRTPTSRLANFLILGLVALMIFDGIRGLGDSRHSPRLSLLSASAILFAGTTFLNRYLSWSRHLTLMVCVLAFAGFVGWFVPSGHGINLWTAYRQIEELRTLPPGDVAAYQRAAVDRRTLVRDFPSFAADVSEAEHAWLRRTVDEVIDSADRQLAKDPDAVLLRLQQLDKELSQLDHYPSVRKDLESARRRAVRACARAQP